VGVDKVLELPEIDRLQVYGHDFKNCWVVYISHTDRWMLRASTIVAVDKRTGQVVCIGSAHDEG
jgi:ABC-type transport system involved in cytochrome bd biosynthesis fused ATPase/permease subunit